MINELAVALTFARRTARRAATAAQLPLREGAGAASAEADRAVNAVIVDAIRAEYPDDAILSEESVDSPERLGAARVWIVDPIDGTVDYQAGRPEYAIMIGLAVDGEAVLGVVFMPAGDRMYAAARGLGATLEVQHETQGLRTDRRQWPPRMIVSRSHPDPVALRIRDELGVTDCAPSGSVGVKCALIAEGKRDLYVHPQPHLKEWDTCAPEVVLTEAGGEVTDCMGEPLRYNKPEAVQPHGILACGPGVMTRVHETVRAIYESSRPSHA